MTVKLYENDSYRRSFSSAVVSCEEQGDGYVVVTESTAFFPEGGGQPADGGTLGGAVVLDVQVKDGVVYHTTDKPLAVGETVTGEIDWALRFSRMQNHTGEHILAGLIHSTFGYDNVGFHMSEQTVTLDVNGPLTAEQIASLEEAANRAVQENKTVSVYFPTEDEIGTLEYRSKLELTENVRLITIEDYDVCACCAPHVAKTGEIGLIKVLDHIPYKGGTRITLVCGMPAVKDYAALHAADREMMRLLSAPRGETLSFVKRQLETVSALRAENARLTSELVLARLETVKAGEVLCGFTSGAGFDALRACIEHIAVNEQLTAVFSLEEDGTAAYILAQADGDVRAIVKELNAAFNGKGGGKPVYAQGKLTATKEDLITFFSA